MLATYLCTSIVLVAEEYLEYLPIVCPIAGQRPGQCLCSAETPICYVGVRQTMHRPTHKSTQPRRTQT